MKKGKLVLGNDPLSSLQDAPPPAPKAAPPAPPAESRVAVQGGLGIRDVEAVKATLVAAPTAGDRLLVDVGEVGSVDTSGVQLLLAFVLERRAAGVQVRFENATDALASVAGLLGVDAELGFAAGERSGW